MFQALSKVNSVLLMAFIFGLADQMSAQVVGGWNPLKPDSLYAKEAAKVALKLYPDSNTWGYPQHLIEVLEAKTQVVAGMNYDLLLKVGVGACDNPQGAPDVQKYDQDCYFEKVGICRFVVFIQTFLDVSVIKNATCQEFVSAWKDVSINDRVVEELTAISLRRLNQGDENQKANLYRMDQAVKNTLTPNVYSVYARISFNCAKCLKKHESRVLLTGKSDLMKHVMTRCEVDDKVVAENTVCTLIPAFPY